jgi:hypothetical protein
MVKFRRAYRAQKNRVRVHAGAQRTFRQRRAVCANGSAANRLFIAYKFTVRKIAQSAEHPHCFTCHFRAYTITGEDCQFMSHDSTPLLLKIIRLLK